MFLSELWWNATEMLIFFLIHQRGFMKDSRALRKDGSQILALIARDIVPCVDGSLGIVCSTGKYSWRDSREKRNAEKCAAEGEGGKKSWQYA